MHFCAMNFSRRHREFELLVHRFGTYIDTDTPINIYTWFCDSSKIEVPPDITNCRKM